MSLDALFLGSGAGKPTQPHDIVQPPIKAPNGLYLYVLWGESEGSQWIADFNLYPCYFGMKMVAGEGLWRVDKASNYIEECISEVSRGIHFGHCALFFDVR